MTTHVYLIQTRRPWLASEVFLATLHTTASGATWAIPARLGGKRFKVGATAFLTREAAERRRLGLCAATLQPHRARTLTRLGFGDAVDAAWQAGPPKVYVAQVGR